VASIRASSFCAMIVTEGFVVLLEACPAEHCQERRSVAEDMRRRWKSAAAWFVTACCSSSLD
jgi:hypothetical protein